MATVITYQPNEWNTSCGSTDVVVFDTPGNRKSELSATVNNKGTCNVQFHFFDGNTQVPDGPGGAHVVEPGHSKTGGQDKVNKIKLDCSRGDEQHKTCKGTMTVVEIRP